MLFTPALHFTICFNAAHLPALYCNITGKLHGRDCCKVIINDLLSGLIPSILNEK